MLLGKWTGVWLTKRRTIVSIDALTHHLKDMWTKHQKSHFQRWQRFKKQSLSMMRKWCRKGGRSSCRKSLQVNGIKTSEEEEGKEQRMRAWGSARAKRERRENEGTMVQNSLISQRVHRGRSTFFFLKVFHFKNRWKSTSTTIVSQNLSAFKNE